MSPSFTAPVSYEPVRPGLSTVTLADGGELSFAQAKARLAALGVLLTKRADEYAVRMKGTPAADAYPTGELADAYYTGLSMSGNTSTAPAVA